MLGIRRKKNDEDESKIDSKESLEAPKKRKPRKKKEPPKPWGRIERIIVFVFLLGLPVLSVIFLYSSKNSKIAKQVTIPAPKLVSAIIPVAARDVNELKDNLMNETQNLEGTYGIWVQSLDNSYTLGINENDSFDGASIFKLPLMIGYYKEVDSGKIDPNTSYTLKFSDAASGAGTLSNLPAGTSVTYHDIVEAIGKNSDNTGFQIIQNVLDDGTENNMINELGMTNTDFSQSITTPKDVGALFYKLVNSNIISQNSKNELLSNLTNTDFESLLPTGIPNNIRVSHKYGADDGELNDAGIVYANRPYILVVLAKDINQDEANLEIPKISKIVYDWATK